jgi:hypothetical protein
VRSHPQDDPFFAFIGHETEIDEVDSHMMGVNFRVDVFEANGQ